MSAAPRRGFTGGKRAKDARGTLKRLIGYIAKGNKARLVCVFILLIISTVASVSASLFLKSLIDDYIAPLIGQSAPSFAPLLQALTMMGCIYLAGMLASYLQTRLMIPVAQGTLKTIRDDMFAHMQTLPIKYFDTHTHGNVMSYYTNDTDTLRQMISQSLPNAVSSIISITAVFIAMLSTSVWLTLLMFVFLGLMLFVVKNVGGGSAKYFVKQQQSLGKVNGFIEEMIGGQKVVKAFGYEKESSRRFDEINKELQNYSQKAVFYSSLTNPSTRFVNNIIYAGVALLGAFLIPGGTLTVGGLSVLLAYANQYMKPFNDISSVVTEMQNALACADRIFDLLEQKEETLDAEGAFATVDGNVTIDDVAFSYDKEKELIENFNLDVKPGMRIAIVGPTGCGKTTFINLLMRFYDVDEGKILVDGKDIREVSRHALRSSFGMVLQDTWIKSGTVRDNICFGKPDATDEEIIRAAKEARSWEFIRRLPKGLDTVLHEDSISQGQKQLLCITRVMLCLPPMLILDEATSSIDTRTELQVQEAFDKLMKGRTSFIVAHRLSTIRNASLILVMKDGKIIEQGNHEELLKKGGFYHKLYHSQFEG